MFYLVSWALPWEAVLPSSGARSPFPSTTQAPQRTVELAFRFMKKPAPFLRRDS
nr:MAG TPA: hypothetical protein [Siphoviridae sp. ctHdl3]DAK65478.1 MAG TPA: hypothetical protein [Caudoviricetes sp.]